MRRIEAIVFGLLVSCLSARASSVLLRVDPHSVPVPAGVTTFGGPAEITTAIVKPSTALTVVWLIDTFDEAGLEEAQSDLVALQKRLPGRSLRLVILRGSDLQSPGPVTGGPAWKKQLDGIELPTASPGAVTDNTLAALDGLYQNIPQLGSKWSSVLVVGRVSNLQPAVAEYASALLLRAMNTQEVRVFLQLQGTPTPPEQFATLANSTGGALVQDLSELPELLDERKQSFLHISWTTPTAPQGFVISHAVIKDDAAAPLIDTLDFADQGAPPISITSVAALQAKLEEVSQMLKQPLDQPAADAVRAKLEQARAVNPLDPTLLRLDASYFEKTKAYPEAVKSASLLAQVRVTDGSAFVVLGHMQVLSGSFDDAEKALVHAAELGAHPEMVAEDLARIHLGRKDDSGAIPYLQTALAADGKRQDLWFLLGVTAESARQPDLAIQALNQGLSLGGTHVEQCGRLVRLYLATSQPAKAREFALQMVRALPSDPGPRAEFAQMLDDAKLREEALAAWQSVIAVRNDAEVAHVRVARLLLELGKTQDALEVSSNDINTFPKNADLYLVKADALHEMFRDYEMHSTLELGASEAGTVNVLSRLATVQDAYGYGSAETYQNLAQKLDPGSPASIAALERGCFVALRDDELAKANDFAKVLGASSKCHGLTRSLGKSEAELLIPGGMDALASMAGMKRGVAPDQFLVEYARALEADVCAGCRNDPYHSKIHKYFETVGELEALGTRGGNTVTIDLAADNNRSKQRSEAVLKLLGLEMSSHGGAVKIDMGAGQNKGNRQEFMSALAIDEVGMAAALEANKPYSITIADEPVGVYPDLVFWRNLMPASARGNLPLALLEAPKLSRIFAALGSMDRRTVKALTDSVSVGDLSDEGVGLLFAYGSCFALQGSSAAVPGGTSAKSVWTRMIGASPDDPGGFFRALLLSSNATQLAFYYEISQLDPPHQAFATANYDRVRRLYEVFSAMHTARGNVSSFVNGSSLAQLLGSIPLDRNGHLAFPGSVEVWSVAKGDAIDDAKLNKMLKKMVKTAAPNEEDDVLVRLADTRYKMNQVGHTELDNFLAVAHVDAHRKTPLDAESALLLAQQYVYNWAAYSYFSDLPGLGVAEFRSFFNLLDSIKQLPEIEQNFALGQLHSLVEWLVLLRRNQLIDDAAAARLFSQVSTKLQATDSAGRTAASLDLAEAILVACAAPNAKDADAALQSCLLGHEEDAWMQMRKREYAMVLDAQKVPSLAALLSLEKSLNELTHSSDFGKKAQDSAENIVKIASALLLVSIPKQAKVDGKEHEVIMRYAPEQVQKRAGELREQLDKHKPNPKSLQSLAADLRKELEPQVTAALAGPVYAYFLRPSDLVVSEDPLLLRKHRFYDFDVHSGHAPEMEESEFVKRSDSAGSYFKGGFAQFSMASGNAAAVGWPNAGNGTQWAIGAQITSLRTVAWEKLHDSDQRLVSLRILGAREWIVKASEDPAALEKLSDRAAGVLSLTRRAALLTGIQDRDWKRVWNSVFIPDLLMIGTDLAKSRGTSLDNSPVMLELDRVTAYSHEPRVEDFGRVPYIVYGCAHPHIVSDRPYEAYETGLPEELGERVADFKLYLAYRADSLGIAPLDLGRIAEPLASRAFKSVKMANFGDWRSILDSYSSIDKKHMLEALEQ